MKKILMIILIGFIAVSILTIMFTIQSIPTFRDFDDDDSNGDNNDDHYRNLNLAQVNPDGSKNIYLEDEVNNISKFHSPMWYLTFCNYIALFIRYNIVNSLRMRKKLDLVYYHRF